MRTAARTLVPLVVLLLAACGGRATMPGPGDDQAPTTLEVDNRSSLDMTIYVIREGGARTRLGSATAHLTTRFTIPDRLMFGITSLRFQADPVGAGRTPVTETINVQAGDTVVLQIPPY